MADKTYVLLDDVIAHIASCERSKMLPVECSAITLIKNVPVADAVEVVRCQDCVHWRGENDICKGIGVDFSADGYCSEGKRKDGGRDDA